MAQLHPTEIFDRGGDVRVFPHITTAGVVVYAATAKLHFAAAEVSFELSADQLETSRGVIQSSGASHLVLLTPTGVVVTCSVSPRH